MSRGMSLLLAVLNAIAFAMLFRLVAVVLVDDPDSYVLVPLVGLGTLNATLAVVMMVRAVR